MSVNGATVTAVTVVAVNVGKNTAPLSVTDADRYRLLGPVDFAMTAPALAAALVVVRLQISRLPASYREKGPLP
jgi:hypothetical protein